MLKSYKRMEPENVYVAKRGNINVNEYIFVNEKSFEEGNNDNIHKMMVHKSKSQFKKTPTHVSVMDKYNGSNLLKKIGLKG